MNSPYSGRDPQADDIVDRTGRVGIEKVGFHYGADDGLYIKERVRKTLFARVCN